MTVRVSERKNRRATSRIGASALFVTTLLLSSIDDSLAKKHLKVIYTPKTHEPHAEEYGKDGNLQMRHHHKSHDDYDHYHSIDAPASPKCPFGWTHNDDDDDDDHNDAHQPPKPASYVWSSKAQTCCATSSIK